MFLLIYITMNFKMSCSSNSGMETIAPLIIAIVNNALLHSNSHIKQMLPQIIYVLHFFLVDLLPQIL